MKVIRRYLPLPLIAVLFLFGYCFLILGGQNAGVEAASPLFVTVQLDKAQYSPGDSVVVSGNVKENSDSGAPVANAQVSLEVDDPNGRIVFVEVVSTGNDGRYAASFVLGPSADNGQYSADAVASKPGFTSGMGSSNFQVIPEFTSGGIVLLAALLLLGFYGRRVAKN